MPDSPPDSTGPEAGSRQSVIDQLAYLLDELAAQKPLAASLDNNLISLQPADGGDSIGDMYLGMAEREEGLNRNVVRALLDGSFIDVARETRSPSGRATHPSGSSLPDIIDRIRDARAANLESMRTAAPEAWSATVGLDGVAMDLLTWGYRMALADADSLRDIAMRLSEAHRLFG